jgi:hypothetical protein
VVPFLAAAVGALILSAGIELRVRGLAFLQGQAATKGGLQTVDADVPAPSAVMPKVVRREFGKSRVNVEPSKRAWSYASDFRSEGKSEVVGYVVKHWSASQLRVDGCNTTRSGHFCKNNVRTLVSSCFPRRASLCGMDRDFSREAGGGMKTRGDRHPGH